MGNSIFFTVVIPTYNRAGFITKTIQSVLGQTFQNFEIIVVDDGSTDNTEEVMKSIISDKITYHKKKNEERAVARNTGARMASGTYVTFFDSDDLLYPNHLQEAYAMVQQHHSPEFFHLGYDIKDPEGHLIGKVDHLEGNLNEKLIEGNILSCNGVFIRKDIILKHPFNEDRALSASEDWELWLRLASRYPLYYSNTITSTVINHDQRSVLVINKDKLIKRQELFVKYVWQDEKCLEKYGKYKSKVIANTYTYIALHLALTKKYRLDVIRYLSKAFIQSVHVLRSRRFYASIKHIF
ncbi:glycosyltransferase [Rhodocytophaga rosea]|uniref:Glycosyltransferase n=1 Tax=Rhodocytophaga rosea TaxID=2704465 RepID=A0A6C0GR59_9BACT|nr:glycosyltransferase [Rhodocytophaga rosea]QHT70551.1 glycosyltransferase [Rhodocytophaga rosea]